MSSYSQIFHDFILDDENKVKALDTFLDGGKIEINIHFTVSKLTPLIYLKIADGVFSTNFGIPIKSS